jgi:hypothetical protein
VDSTKSKSVCHQKPEAPSGKLRRPRLLPERFTTTLFEAADRVGQDMFDSIWTDVERNVRKRPLTDSDIDVAAMIETIDAVQRQSYETEAAAREGREWVLLDPRGEAKIRNEISEAAERHAPHRERRWAANERMRKLYSIGHVGCVAFDPRSGKTHSIPTSVWLSTYVDDVFITGHIEVLTRADAEPEFGKWQGGEEPTWWVLVRTDQLIRALSGDPNPSAEWSTEERMRSGGPGPRTTSVFVMEHAKRRAERGQLKPTRWGEAEYLAKWAREAYPDHSNPGVKTISNKLPKEWWSEGGRRSLPELVFGGQT